MSREQISIYDSHSSVLLFFLERSILFSPFFLSQKELFVLHQPGALCISVFPLAVGCVVKDLIYFHKKEKNIQSLT